MNPRTSGTISKKYLGTPKHNANGFPMRMDAVYVNGNRYGYFSNAPKDNPSLEAITDRYPECKEGIAVDIEYDVTQKDGKTYQNIKDMSPSGGSLAADDPVRRIATRVPDHLKPGGPVDEPRPDEHNPALAHQAPPAARAGDAKDWQIVRCAVAKALLELSNTDGAIERASLHWTGEPDTPIEDIGAKVTLWIMGA